MTTLAQATPSQRLFHTAHKERLARLNPVPVSNVVQIAPEMKPLGQIVEALVEKIASPEVVTVKSIGKFIARRYDIPLAILFGPERSAYFVRARQITYWLSKHLTKCSLPEIGRRMDRDHTSVLHGIRKVDRMMARDPEFAAEVNALADLLKPTKEKSEFSQDVNIGCSDFDGSEAQAAQP
jgi:hypothetical protein